MAQTLVVTASRIQESRTVFGWTRECGVIQPLDPLPTRHVHLLGGILHPAISGSGSDERVAAEACRVGARLAKSAEDQ
jgi:hypothetical protein